MSAIIPGRRIPRSFRWTRAAAFEVILRIASSSVRTCSSRTYLPRMRGKEPHARGCDFDSDSLPSSACAPESVPTPTSGCCNAVRTSSSLMMEMMTELDREEHTSELQSQSNLVCRLLLEKKKKKKIRLYIENKKHIE